jgi:nucleotide-binding universal stress UspA family protein
MDPNWSSITLGVDANAPHRQAREWVAERAADGARTVQVVAVTPAGERREPDVDEVVAGLRDACPEASVTVDLRAGSVVGELVGASESDDLLVVGSFRGRRGTTIGRVPERLAERALVPVVVVPDHDRTVEGDVVLAVDEPLDERAVTIAVSEAVRRHRRLTLLRAWEMPVITRTGLTDFAEDPLRWRRLNAEILDRVAAELAARYPEVRLHRLLVEGHPGRAIVDHTRLASLVVLGQGHVHVLSGSVLHSVLRESAIPVCVVPPAPAATRDEQDEQDEQDERAAS